MTARDVAVIALALTGLLTCREPEPPSSPESVVPSATFQRRYLGTIPESAEDVLERNEFHEYDLGELTKGDAVHVVIEQRGLDIAAQVIDADDSVVLEVDGPTGAYGFEHICFVATGPVKYRLRVGPLSAAGSGPYGIRITERAPPTSNQRIRHCQEAFRIFVEAESRRTEATSEVTSLYRQAVELWRKSEEPFPLVIALKQAGSFAALRGDLDSALRSYTEALALLRELGVNGDLRQLAAVLNLAGLARNLAGEPELARQAFEEARAISQQVGDRVGEATAISNFALWEQAGGDLYHAVDLLREALAIWRDIGRPSDEATTLNVLGVTLTRLGLYDQALDVLHNVLEIRSQTARPDQLANTWIAIGWAEHLAGRGEVAIDRFQRAAELYHEAGARLDEAGAYDRLGSAYRELGRVDDARRAYERSHEVYRASANRLHTAHSASNLGCLVGDRQLLTEAGDTFASLGDRAALAHVRFCQARLDRDAGNLGAALRYIEEAVSLVDVLRGTAFRQGHEAPTLELWQKYSQLQVDLLMRLHQQSPDVGYAIRAFELSDLARARRLSEMLLEAQIDVRAGAPEDLLEEERGIQRRLNAIELRRQSLLERKGISTEVSALDERLRDQLRELAGVQAAIRSASPRFAELRQPSPVGLAEVQELLAPDTLLLSYVLGEEQSFLFVVRRDGFESHLLPEKRRIDDLAWRVYEGLRNSQQRRTRSQLPVVARQVGNLLLGPVRGQLADHRLLVVGDGLLHYVPLSALPLTEPSRPTDDGEGGDGDKDELVVDRYEVVHLPSAAVMKALRQRAAERPRPSKVLAVVADAVYSAQDGRLPPTARAQSPAFDAEPLLDLPYTEREAASILALVEPKDRLAALGLAANPELVRSGALSGYRILHFATHGLLNEEQPELSGIALSMFDEAGRPRDGYLRLHEIYALDLPADLVVLSACRTALTQQAQGSGLTGLTSGFFYAGASRLVVSLWDVDDEATAELMKVFYRGLLLEGLSSPEALQEAQCWMRGQERWQAAYYWAGFVLEGDWR